MYLVKIELFVSKQSCAGKLHHGLDLIIVSLHFISLLQSQEQITTQRNLFNSLFVFNFATKGVVPYAKKIKIQVNTK